VRSTPEFREWAQGERVTAEMKLRPVFIGKGFSALPDNTTDNKLGFRVLLS
jgi:hypothetical protein